MDESHAVPDPHGPNGVTVGLGVGLGFALHLFQIVYVCLQAAFWGGVARQIDPSGSDLPPGVIFVVLALTPFGIGLNQILYLAPAVFAAWRFGRTGILIGMIIAGSITFLLNAACWGWLIGLRTI